MTVKWAIGIDGGGTKTAALCQTVRKGLPLRRSESGPCNIAAMDIVEASANIDRCVESLSIDSKDVSSLCIGVAGYSAVEKRRQFINLVRSRYPSAAVEVAPDYLIAHSGAFPEGSGVIVIAGTGSIAYGVNPIGESAVVGGYGYLIDDQGTGYGLGRSVLAAAGKTFDGTGGAEILTRLFIDKTGITTREALIAEVYGGRLDRLTIASFAPLVTEAAAAGDQYADSLLMHAGGALARVAQSAVVRLFAENETVPVARVGGLWSAGGELSDVFERSLQRACKSVVFVPPSVAPAEGALNRALAAVPR